MKHDKKAFEKEISEDNQNMFGLNLLFNKTTDVFVVIPEINIITFEFLKDLLELISYYDSVTMLCNKYEFSFYKMLFDKSDSFKSFTTKIIVESLNPLSFKFMLSKKCLIFDFTLKRGKNNSEISGSDDSFLKNIKNKKAIYCSLNKFSDISFSSNNDDSADKNQNIKSALTRYSYYIQDMIRFVNCENKAIRNSEENRNDKHNFLNGFNKIDMNENIILESSIIYNKKIKSQITNNNESIDVIYLERFINEIKINSFLKKNSINETLIIVSKYLANNNFLTTVRAHTLVTNSKIILIDEYDFLDSLALELIAKRIAYSRESYCRTVISNLRINLSFFSVYKDFSSILYDISEPINQ